MAEARQPEVHADEYTYRRRSHRKRVQTKQEPAPRVEEPVKVLPFPKEERSFLGGLAEGFKFRFDIEELLLIGLIILLWSEEERDDTLIVLLAFLLFA